jgi:hypothetical protein
MKTVAQLCFVAGLLSIPLSIALWAWGPELSSTTLEGFDRSAHKERWGIFVGLWAPTFLILSQILEARVRDCRATLAEMTK